MARVGIGLAGGGPFHDAAGVHDVDAVGVARDHAEIVGDHDHGHAEPARQALHQLEYLSLYCDIQRGGGLIGQDEGGVAGQGHGDHHPLPHPAAELVGILSQSPLGIGDAHEAKELDGARPRLRRAHPEMDLRGLGQLAADGEDGVERGHRLLEDHGDLAPADLAHLVFRKLEEIASLEEDAPAEDAAGGGGDQPHDAEGAHGLAAARLADEGNRLPRPHVPGHAVHGAHDAAAGRELGLEVLHVEEEIPALLHVRAV